MAKEIEKYEESIAMISEVEDYYFALISDFEKGYRLKESDIYMPHHSEVVKRLNNMANVAPFYFDKLSTKALEDVYMCIDDSIKAYYHVDNYEVLNILCDNLELNKNKII